ncbi:MAG: transposase [Chloroflexi bacterium]|nr:transposase [Chloroflexota bacterium]
MKAAERKSSCLEGWVPAGTRIPLRLTRNLEEYCRQVLGVGRFCYNLAVATHRFHRINRLPWPSWQDTYKAFNACKHEDYPFVTKMASRVAEGAFMEFGKAVANWRNPNTKSRVPKFLKRKLTGEGSFRAASGVQQIRYNGKRRARLPVIGFAKLAHTLPKGIYHDAHIRLQNGRWYLCLKYCKEPEARPQPDQRITGAVDSGINPHASDSDGQTYENPKAYYQIERRLRRWQRAQARRQRSSRGWHEAQRRINRCHRRIRGIRQNAVHQMTHTLTRKYHTLVIEDLNVQGMKQGLTPKAQADASMGEIRRQLEYKCNWRHTDVVVAHRFYPISKLCNACQTYNAKIKRERYWTCETCGTRHERNANAAIKLRNLFPKAGGQRSVTGKL